MRKTLGQAKSSTIMQSIGISTCNPKFVALLNETQQELADAGKWWGTYQRMYVCVTGGCITWPRHVAAIEGFRMCGSGVKVLNEWYDFAEEVYSPGCCTTDTGWCSPQQLVARPNSPLVREFSLESTIRIYPASESDVGKRVLLQGIDANGNKIRSLDGSVYVDGVYLTLASPFAETTQTFNGPSLTGVQKPVTNDRLAVFSVDSEGNELSIATWEPSEENPDYRRSWINGRPQDGFCCAASNGCSTIPNCTGSVAEAIVRLEFFPALVDTDWLFIGNIPALKEGMRSVQKRDRDREGADTHRGRAIELLRNEVEKYAPKSQVRVNFKPNGTASNRRVLAGMM